MTLHPPFIITARLLPGLRLADAVLSYEGSAGITADHRDIASMVLDIPGQDEYIDDRMKSGCGGFRHTVDVFESFLSFLLAAVESFEYGERTGTDGENTDLFPRRIVEWASENKNEIESVLCDLHDEEGATNRSLIEA